MNVEPIRLSRKGWSTFLEAVNFYKDEDDEVLTYLLHRALESRRRERSGWTLYPITQAERDAVLGVTQEFAEINVGL